MRNHLAETRFSLRKNFFLSILLFSLSLFSAEKGWGQTTVTYVMQDANFPTQFNSGGDFYNPSGATLGMWANSGSKQTVAWRMYKTAGDNTGSDRTLQVGDIFKITVSCTRAFGQIGFSLNAGGTQGSSYNNRISGSRLYFNTDNYGAWYVNRSGGNSDLSYTPIQSTYKDYIFTIRITSSTTADVFLTVDGTDYRAYNLTMNGSGNIDAFSIYGSDMYDGDSNDDAFWKQTCTVENTGRVELGYFLPSGTYTPGVISDGLAANSTTTSSTNNVFVGGDAGSVVVLGSANTYTGTTTINANATLRLGASSTSSSSGPLGTTASGTTISTGGVLDLRGVSLTSSATEPFTINGDGISSGGAIINSGATLSTLAGTVTLNSGSRINASTSAITLEGNVSVGNNVLFIGGANNTTLSAVLSGAGATQSGTTTSVYKDGEGTLTLSGTNTYTGDTRIVQGNLTVSSTGNLGSGSDIFISSGASLTVNNSITVASVQETANTNGGTVSIASGSTLTIDGANKATIYQNSISGFGGLTMSGSGTTELVLYGTQSYTGITRVTSGKLSTGVALSSTDLRVSGGTLQMNAANVISNTATLLLSGGTFSTGSATGYSETLGVLTISGGGTSTISLGTGAHNLIFAASNGTWNGSLSITGWTGSTGRIYFSNTSGGLDPAQLASITFSGFDAGAILLSDGELVPSTIHSITGISASPNNGTSTNGYIGSTITVTGSNFTSTGLTITMQNGGAISSYSFTSSTQISFTLPAGYSGTITITKNGAPKTSSGSITNLGYISTQNGDWGTNTTWLGGAVPPVGSTVTIDHNVNVNSTVTNSPTTVTINSSDVLTFSGNFSLTATTINNSGTITMVNGSTININGTMNNTGTLNMVTGSTVNMANNTTWTGNGTIGANGVINFSNGNISSTSTFPNVRIQSGSVNFKASGTIGSATIGTSLEFLSLSFINSNSPFYANGSTLIYNSGGNFNRGPEWGQLTPGAQGFPHHVLVKGSTTLHIGDKDPASNTFVNLEIAGDLTIDNSTVQMNSVFGFSNFLNDGLTIGRDLILTNGGDLNLNDVSNPLLVGRHLTIGATGTGSDLNLSSEAGGDLSINGNFSREAGSSFNDNGRATSLLGSENTTIFGATAQTFSYLIIDKQSPSNTVTLNSAVSISQRATFTDGIVISSSANPFVFQAGSAVASASFNSFVQGPVEKTGNSPFTFPTGTSVGASERHYRPIGISNLSGTNTYTATFQRLNPYDRGPISGPARTAGLSTISRCEYWDLTRTTGGQTATITLSWSTNSIGTSKCNVADYVIPGNESALRVVPFANATASSWGDNFGINGSPSIPDASNNFIGTVSWNMPADAPNNYQHFVLGTTDWRLNPLPVEVKNFKASAKENLVKLDWSVNFNDQVKSFVIERSKDGIHFETLKQVIPRSNEVTASYADVDRAPYNGWGYYRLRITDLSGQITYTSTQKVWMGKKGTFIQILPNPAVSDLWVNITEPEKITELNLMNNLGQVLYKTNKLNSLNRIDVSSFAPGIYYLRMTGKDGVYLETFIKN